VPVIVPLEVACPQAGSAHRESMKKKMDARLSAKERLHFTPLRPFAFLLDEHSRTAAAALSHPSHKPFLRMCAPLLQFVR
jgi:hypothetical protein